MSSCRATNGKATALVHELDALGFNVCNDNGRVRLEEAAAFAAGFREAGFVARVLAAKPAKKAARRKK